MRKIRGFRIRHKFVKVFNWAVHRRKRSVSYRRLNPQSCAETAITKLCNLGRCLRQGAKGLRFLKPGSGYVRIGEVPVENKPPPKGHLAVYVGEKEDDAHRVLVPVIYFNHPLFGDLLREAEKVYGFNHQGGIQIPCRISEFENVQMRITAAAGSGGDGSCGRARRSRRLTYW